MHIGGPRVCGTNREEYFIEATRCGKRIGLYVKSSYCHDEITTRRSESNDARS